MSVNRPVFLDTNIFIYAYSLDETEKYKIAKELISQDFDIVISTQVINEFVNVMRRKRAVPYATLSKVIHELTSLFKVSLVTLESIEQALEISERCKYSYFDSLIISSAIKNSCGILYSEDMHNKHVVADGLTIVNPFV